jgi:hypothetical protein
MTPRSASPESATCTAFAGHRWLASGDLVAVAVAARKALDAGERAPMLAFEDATARQLELDLRGSLAEVKARHAARRDQPGAPATPPPTEATDGEPRGPGRPRLGVVAREVTLLPRHWEWLSAQPGGASVALRKLVEEARHGAGVRDRVRRAQEVAYRFMTALAGDLPGYEEAIRALFAGDRPRFEALTGGWPDDVAAYALRLAEGAFQRG